MVPHATSEFRTPGMAADSTKRNRVYRIVLTGGPCAGKTTALARMSERLNDFGFTVLRVPEAATLLQSGGLTFAGLRQEQVVDMQAHLMRTQAALEDEFDGIARSMTRYSSHPAVLICDRGLMDGRAYVTSAMFREVVLAARVDPRVEHAVEAVLPELIKEEESAHGEAPSAGDGHGWLRAGTSIRVARSSSDTQLPVHAHAASLSSTASAHGEVATAGASPASGLGLVADLHAAGDAASGAVGLPVAAASLLPSLTPHAGPAAAQRLRFRQQLMRHPLVAAAVAEAVARMRDERYDAVLHLVTAADGAEENYTLQNNATRTETVEQAVAVDCAIREAWLGSPAHRIVGNRGPGGFEGKMDLCVSSLSRQLGLPLPGAVKRFWVLRCDSIDNWAPPPGIAVRDFAVVHTYLHDSAGKWTSARAEADGAADADSGGETTSVRLTLRRALDLLADEDAVAAPADSGGDPAPSPVRTDDGGIPLGGDGVPLTVVASGLNSGELTLQLRAARMAGHSTARPLAESQRMLKPREYASLLDSRDTGCAPVAKWRRVFVHGSRAFELDEITAPAAYRGLCLLSVEVNDEEADVALPVGISPAGSGKAGIAAEEVTGDPRFLTSSLARGTGPSPGDWGSGEGAGTRA